MSDNATAKQALHLKRCERGAWSTANRWAGADEQQHPYWLGNVRVYSNVALRFGDRRIAVLRAYLSQRQNRSAP